jgi:hypothetical protein
MLSDFRPLLCARLRSRRARADTDIHHHIVHMCRPWLARAYMRRGLRSTRGSRGMTNLVKRRISYVRNIAIASIW